MLRQPRNRLATLGGPHSWILALPITNSGFELKERRPTIIWRLCPAPWKFTRASSRPRTGPGPRTTWVTRSRDQAARTKGVKGAKLLAQAVAALRSCLEIYTAEAFPFDHERAQEQLKKSETLLTVDLKFRNDETCGLSRRGLNSESSAGWRTQLISSRCSGELAYLSEAARDLSDARRRTG
jgi:hypothetical protein